MVTANNYKKYLGKVEQEKDIGVLTDDDRDFEHRAQAQANKASRVMGQIRRSFSFLNKDTFVKLYKAFIRPFLEYALALWSPYRENPIIESGPVLQWSMP